MANTNGAAVIWGEAIAQSTVERLDATRLRDVWTDSAAEYYFDGFYAAVAYYPDLGLRVGADVLGFFPIYYYNSGDVALVGSSPELFRYHPCFKSAFNPTGLVGILLTNSIVNGQTLWQDVQRLEAGHLLIWQSQTAPKQVKQYRLGDLSSNYEYTKLSFDQHLDVLEQVIEQTLKRHAPTGTQHSLFLSGGLDSRTLAGFLHRQGVETVALTLGVAGDLEMSCANSVARTLGFAHYPITIPFEEYPAGADFIVKWEHLANGCNWVMNPGLHVPLKQFAPRVILGYSIDLLIGVKGAYQISDPNLSFDAHFKRAINNWGFAPHVLNQLLRQDVFDDLVDSVLAQIEQLSQTYSDVEFKRAVCFEFYHRQRFHVGCSAWEISFGAWPVLPILDRQLLETIMALPIETLIKRRAQKQLVCTRFPKLAQLPLDQGSYYNTDPLKSSPIRQQLSLLFKMQKQWRKLQHQLGYERRYFQRIFDIDSPGWRMFRQQVEPYRSVVQPLFNQEIFNQMVPPPNVRVNRINKDSSAEISGIKTLLGFLLWSKNYL